MKLKASLGFRPKFLKTCKKFITLFRFRLKKQVFIRVLLSPAKYRPLKLKALDRYRVSSVLPFSKSSKKSKAMIGRSEVGSSSCRTEIEMLTYPSSSTPGYVEKRKFTGKRSSGHSDVEDACRRFENCLLDMIFEDGRTRNLTDMEELLYCWKNLKCPAFIDLVCRFYGEICKDLF